MSDENVVSGCSDPDCLMCSGEACNLCGAGCWSKVKNCEHDVIDRHEEPERTMTTDNEQTTLEPQHNSNCAWARTTNNECEYRDSHNYCPHPEHACSCPPQIKSDKWERVTIKSGDPRVVAIRFENAEKAAEFIETFTRVSAASTAPVVDEQAINKAAQAIMDCFLMVEIDELPRSSDIRGILAQHFAAAASPAAPAIAACEVDVAPADHLFIRLLQEQRKWYDEDIFRSWTLEEAKAVHASFPGAVDRIAAESARKVIDRIADDVRAGKHRTWEDNTLNGNDVTFAASPAAPQEDAPCPFSPDSELYWPPSTPTPSLPAREAEEFARQIVGTVFDNTAASPETLKQTMIERIAAALRELFQREGIEVK